MPIFASELDTSFDAFEKECQAFSIQSEHSHQTRPARITINAPPKQVMNAWFDCIWMRGGGMGQPTELRKALKPNGEGHIRTPGYGLFELMLRVDEDNPSHLMIHYTIARGLPLSSHYGTVYFEPADENGSTCSISWIVRYTPKWYGYWFGAYCEKLLFPFFLRNLKADVEHNVKQ